METPTLLDRPDLLAAPRLVSIPATDTGGDHPARSFNSLTDVSAPAPHPLYQSVVKRAFDLTAATAALLFLWPIFLVVAVAIRTDSPGPVIFRQQRIGLGGQPFTMYKFRSMTWDPGHNVRFIIEPDGTTVHKFPHDPRVTRVGAWLRHTSIDELPQLINIIKGDMSVIGPRPELIEVVRTYEPWQHRRHIVRPGLTGWWQVCGRDDCPMEENTDLDLYYIDHLSPLLDLKITLRTIQVVLTGSGAY